MSKKSGNVLEKYIDKIILGIVGLVGLYVLYAYVLTSPNTIVYNGDKHSPSDLDKTIRDQARVIEDKLGGQETVEKVYKPKFSDFKSMLTSPLKNIDDSMYIQLPAASAAVNEKQVYDIPKVCDVNNVKVRTATAVAYVPKRPLEADDSYAAADTELADIDLVTVEATIDAAELSNRFAQSFRMAKNLAWAKPVFAQVQLERQELLKNGSWSDWQTVSRTKIGEFRSRFNIPQKVNKLEKSIEILMLQFDRPETKAELLQPRTYDFAYPAVSWLPPNLAAKRQDKLDKLRIEEQKKRREESRRAEEEKSKSRAAAAKASSSSATGGRTAPGQGGATLGMGGTTARPAPGAQGSQTRPQTIKQRDTAQSDAADRTTRSTKSSAAKPEAFVEEQEFAKLKITEKTDFAAMKEPLLFWAHDDTAEPGKTYKYKIRVGVFDPIAGTNSFNDRDKALKDDVILWSNYSKDTEPFTIPGRWYFFPQNYRDTDKMVNAHVCRYLLAKWYSKDFRVKPGEVIGVASESAKTGEVSANEPNDINYSNGTVLVDVVPVLELDKNYANALFAADSKTIDQIAIKQQYWSSDLKAKFEEIARLQKEPAPVFVARSGERVR